MLSQDLQSLSAWLQHAVADKQVMTADQMLSIARELESSIDKAQQLERTCVAQAVRLMDPLAPNVVRLPERPHGG